MLVPEKAAEPEAADAPILLETLTLVLNELPTDVGVVESEFEIEEVAKRASSGWSGTLALALQEAGSTFETVDPSTVAEQAVFVITSPKPGMAVSKRAQSVNVS